VLFFLAAASDEQTMSLRRMSPAEACMSITTVTARPRQTRNWQSSYRNRCQPFKIVALRLAQGGLAET
jgi:hypothetical protein